MAWFSRFVSGRRRLGAGDRFRRELAEEMNFHRAMKEEQLVDDGLEREEARSRAAREFGNEARLRDVSQEIAGFRMESIVQDVRFAMRQLRRSPGFAATAMAVLALGLAASVAIFSFVDAALLKPLPYRDSSRLVALYERATLCQYCNLSYQDFLDWQRGNTVFSSMNAWTWAGFLWKGPSGVAQVPAVRTSGGFFETLGVKAALGRTLLPSDDRPEAPRVVMLTWSAWQQRFGGQKEIVGQNITLDDQAYTVVGVLPREFHFAPRGKADMWAPMHDPNYCEKRRSCHNMYAVGRLKDGVSVAQADAEVSTIAERLQKQYPDSNKGQAGFAMPLSDAILRDVRPILLVLLAGALLLLLIACVNVASLLLVRSESRRREMAVRGALGASRARLLRQMMTEGVVLVAGGIVLGLAAAYVAMHLLLSLIPADALAGMPYLAGVGLNPRVLAFAGVSALLAAAVFSIVPALRLPAGDLRHDLADGGGASAGRAWRRLGANLVAVELALAVMLLAGAGLLAKSFYRLLHVELNFNPDHLATLRIQGSETRYGKPEEQVALSRHVIERLSALPSVVSVGNTSILPVTCNCNTTWFRILGKPYNGEHNDAPERQVSPDYFHTLQARVIRGRLFNANDTASSTPVMVINQTLAKQFFPDEDPLGKMIGDTDLSPKSMRQVVGVVDDIREGGLDEEIRYAVYEPFEQSPDYGFAIMVRTTGDAASMLPELVRAVHEVDPSIGVSDEMTLQAQIDASQTAYLHRGSAWLVGGFAGMALLLGVVGLYGVTAYSVSQRTREIGVRMALGAPRAKVYRMVLGEAVWLVAAGLAAGLLCSIGAAMLMRKLLFGVQAWDASTLAVVALVLGVSALAASWLPARRAAGVSPVEALRTE